MESTHPSLFVEEDLPRYAPEAQGARERLEDMLGKMRAAATWPWKAATVSHYRETVWPALLGKLGDEAEAARLRSEMDAETIRLDAA